MVKIIISFKKEYFYFFLFVIGIFGFILFVQAYDDSFTSGDITPLDFGHSADEIDVKVPNSSSSNPAKTLQQAIDNQDLSAWTKSGNNIFYSNTGNVGIGTTDPVTKLDVNGDVTLSGPVYVGTNPIYFGSPSASYWIQNLGWNVGMGYNHNRAHIFRLDGTEAVRISGGGNVGIGTADPSERLDLGGGNIAMGYEIVSNTVSSFGATVTCPVGKKVIGGGCNSDNANAHLYQSFPWNNGWSCSIQMVTTLTAYAICANIK